MESLTKNQKVILVAVAAALVCFALWYFAVTAQNRRQEKVSIELADAERRLQDAERLARSADQVEASLEETRQQLLAIEEGMASGDLYTWSLSVFTRFASGYNLRPPYIQRPSTNEVRLLADFPYLATTIRLDTAGHFHEVGRFLADFENQFPFFMLQNLKLEQASGAQDKDERLRLEMEIVALVKPDSNR
jgi:hypothetical protein